MMPDSSHVRITTEPLDVSACIERVRHAGIGAIAVFVGTVRDMNDGRPVSGLEYAAYDAMAQQELRRIVNEVARQFEPCTVAVEHRVGALDIGDDSVIVAAAHAHRAHAFDACRYVIEQLKQRVPIWKREQYLDGTREWIDPTRHSVRTG